MYYIITSPLGVKFNAIINNYEINIGGDEYSCLEIGRTSNNYLNIVADKRKSSCYLNENLPNNLLDAKELIRASVYVLKKIDSDRCYLELSDNSSKNGISISYASLFFQLQTWYEKYFKAELVDDKYKKSYKILKDNMKSQKFKNEIKFKKILENCKTPNDNIEILMKIFNNSNTLYDFGQNIYNKYKYNTSYAYNLLNPWLNLLIEGSLNGGFIKQQKWLISCYNVNTEGFSMEKTQPFKLKWIAKKILPIHGGSNDELKDKLSEIDREMLKSPNYQFWNDVLNNEYNNKDEYYIKKWYKKLRMSRFF